ncbi:MAG: hypothetical protein ACI9T8_000226 [Candidatus Saccharimonadales bacterium]|jgi:hypothetical protein
MIMYFTQFDTQFPEITEEHLERFQSDISRSSNPVIALSLLDTIAVDLCVLSSEHDEQEKFIAATTHLNPEAYFQMNSDTGLKAVVSVEDLKGYAVRRYGAQVRAVIAAKMLGSEVNHRMYEDVRQLTVDISRVEGSRATVYGLDALELVDFVQNSPRIGRKTTSGPFSVNTLGLLRGYVNEFLLLPTAEEAQ